ncbi:unnamed protein product, partial [Brenthis ino]
MPAPSGNLIIKLFWIQATLLIKLSVIWSAEMPLEFICGASAALAAVALAPAARAARNAYTFLRPARRPK